MHFLNRYRACQHHSNGIELALYQFANWICATNLQYIFVLQICVMICSTNLQYESADQMDRFPLTFFGLWVSAYFCHRLWYMRHKKMAMRICPLTHQIFLSNLLIQSAYCFCSWFRNCWSNCCYIVPPILLSNCHCPFHSV